MRVSFMFILIGGCPLCSLWPPFGRQSRSAPEVLGMMNIGGRERRFLGEKNGKIKESQLTTTASSFLVQKLEQRSAPYRCAHGWLDAWFTGNAKQRKTTVKTTISWISGPYGLREASNGNSDYFTKTT